ncbi:MAG TPA: hypothetical protein VMU01_00010 [Rhizomicrobium sp.]|nr:hypothetical protein [Rhizomicrobium sp.]
MEITDSDLDALQAAYKAAVEALIAAIRSEEALASVPHDVAELDKWEAAHFAVEEARTAAAAAKTEYEDGLRRRFFQF